MEHKTPESNKSVIQMHNFRIALSETVQEFRDGRKGVGKQTASKSYLQKWGVKATLLDRLTPYRSIPRFLWHESFMLPLRRMVAHQNALQRVRSASLPKFVKETLARFVGKSV